MIDRKAFLDWVKLPASAVTFSRNGSEGSAYVTLRIDGTAFDYHVRRSDDGFILDELSYQANNNSRDAAEFCEDQCDPELPTDSLEDQLAEQFHDLALPRSVLERFAAWHRSQSQNDLAAATRMTRGAVGFILNASNIKLAGYGLAIALGMDVLMGKTDTAIAQELCVTRQAVSKTANAAADAIGVARSRYMKSTNARAAYRSRANQVHRRGVLRK